MLTDYCPTYWYCKNGTRESRSTFTLADDFIQKISQYPFLFEESQEPQILVACLMVSTEGFSVNYEIFADNTIEGNSIIPVMKDYIRNLQIKTFTVVSDTAMITTENTQALNENGLNYIVGARMGNLSNELIT